MKQDQSWNHKNEAALRRGVEGARDEAVDMSPVSGVVSKMLSQGQSRRNVWVPARYVLIGGAAATCALVALYPRPSNATPLSVIDKAVRQQVARYEEVYKPDANGKMYRYMEQWGEPGKYALRFADDGMEIRQNGHVNYGYWKNSNRQRIEAGPAEEIDPVGVAEYGQFKLLRVVSDGPHRLRYVFNIRQDLVVDTATNLPIERDVYNRDGSMMEVHVYHFYRDLDDAIFNPHVRPGVPLDNIIEDQHTLAAILSQPPQTAEVAGTKVRLYAVIVDHGGSVGAIIDGGDPRGTARAPMQVVGLPAGFAMSEPKYTAFAKLQGAVNDLSVGGHPARLDKIVLPPLTSVPDNFTLRIPVWRYDPSLPLFDKGVRAGTDSRVIGWAEFKVNRVLRTEQVEKVMPNYQAPDAVQTASTVDAPKAIPPRR